MRFFKFFIVIFFLVYSNLSNAQDGDLKNKITERYNYYTNKPNKSTNKKISLQ